MWACSVWTLPTILCCCQSCLVLLAPVSSYIGWKFDQDIKGPKVYCSLVGSWWFVLLAKAGKVSARPGSSVPTKKGGRVDWTSWWKWGIWELLLGSQVHEERGCTESHIRPIYQFWEGLGEAFPWQFVEMNLDNCSYVNIYEQRSWEMSLIYKE